MRNFMCVRARLLSFRVFMPVSLVLALCAALVATPPVLAVEDPGAIVQVEEDWELVVDQPDTESCAPQATCVFAPLGDANNVYAALDVNHRSQPEFANGGLQLQVWAADEPLATAESSTGCKLHHDNETICWTSRMKVENGQLTFAVVNGSSESWGAFGNGELSIQFSTSLTNLNQYNPQVSVSNSGIGFAGNRVIVLKLKKVRTFTAAGDIVEDSTVRVVHARD